MPEKDWKAFKRIRARALERFARRTLEACRELMDEDEKETVVRMLSLSTLLRHACPGVSGDLIRKTLKAEQKAGRVQCTGRGRGARWRKL